MTSEKKDGQRLPSLATLRCRNFNNLVLRTFTAPEQTFFLKKEGVLFHQMINLQTLLRILIPLVVLLRTKLSIEQNLYNLEKHCEKLFNIYYVL